jgi:hypothetical protein
MPQALIASEHEEQCALVQWAEISLGKYPALRWMYAVPNGGLRSRAVAGKLKAEGVRPGVPDLVVPAPIDPYHGAYLEMKRIDGRATPAQLQWREYLVSAGYAHCIAQGFEEARDFLVSYLKGRWQCA